MALSATAAPTEPVYQKKIERFVQTEWIVGSALGFKTAALAQFENRIRKVGAWAAEHQLPMPSGFSLFADSDAGFIFGTRLGAELIFLVPENGNVQMGVFAATDAQLGAEATLGVGAGVSLIFNMEKLEDISGPIVGANTDIRMIEGVGASLTIDVESEELGKVRDAFLSFALERPETAARQIQTLVTQKRLVAIGAQYDWGVGSEISVAAGWRTQLYATELPLDRDLAKAKVEDLKLKVRKALLKFSQSKHNHQLVNTPVGPVLISK